MAVFIVWVATVSIYFSGFVWKFLGSDLDGVISHRLFDQGTLVTNCSPVDCSFKDAHDSLEKICDTADGVMERHYDSLFDRLSCSLSEVEASH